MGLAVRERETAAAAVKGTLDAARTGRGGALFLVGEAGLGKTTMLEHARTLAGSDFALGVGHADATEAALPFGIFSQALDGLGTRGILDAETTPGVSVVDARAARFYSVLRFLEAKSSQPLLLLLDDVHWADPDSIGLLSFLCRRISSLPIAIIASLRPWPPQAYQVAQRLMTSGDAEVEQLRPLSAEAAVSLLAERVNAPLSEDQVRRAASLTAGNPLLIEQLAHLITRGQAMPEADSSRSFEVDLLRARFAGGSPAQMRFADAACLFGTSFEPSLAAELADLSAGEADAALEGLCAAGIVRATAPGTAEFVHPLLRQTLYDHIAAPVRARKHAAAFRILLRRGADPAEAADQAMRADLIGDAEAIAILHQAGTQAQAAGALVTAQQRLEAAVRFAGARVTSGLLIQLAEVLLATADARGAQQVCQRLLGMDQLAERERVTGRRLLGRARFIGGEPQAAQRELQLAAESSTNLTTAETVEALLEAVYVSWPTGGPALATPLAERARELSQQLPDSLRLKAQSAWGFCALVGGDPAGVEVIEQAARAAQADPVSDLGTFAWTWGALGLHGNVAKWMERFDQAQEAFTVGMAAAERLNLPVAIASLAVMHGDTCARTGRLQEGLRLLDRASALAELAPERAFWAAVAHSYILIEMGRSEEALSWAQTAHGLANPEETWPGWMWLWHVDAQLAHQQRRFDEECRLFERIETLADQTQILEPCVVPWMGDAMAVYAGAQRYADADRVLKRLEASVAPLPCLIPRVVIKLAHATRFEVMQQVDEARSTYQEALAMSREVPAPPLQARVLLRYGMYLRKQGQTTAARTPLAQALELAESVAAEPIAVRAAKDLELVGGRRRRTYQDPDALTPAESRIASLAADALSGKEVGQRLNVSIHTVETHLQHVYRKLGIRSQRELMRLAAEGRLSAAAARGKSAAQAGRSADRTGAAAQSPTRG